MIRATIAVFMGCASKFRHGDYDNIFHAVAQVLVKRVETLTQIAEQIRELALHAAFVDVIVPAAGIEERYLQSDIRLQKLGDLLDRKSTRLNFSHLGISYAVFCLKK